MPFYHVNSHIEIAYNVLLYRLTVGAPHALQCLHLFVKLRVVGITLSAHYVQSKQLTQNSWWGLNREKEVAFRTESKNRGFFVIMGVDLHGDEVWIDDGADKMGDGIRKSSGNER